MWIRYWTYVGCYDAESLVAVADLCLDYPQTKVVYVGFFMVNALYQRKNIGTFIIEEMCCRFKELGFETVRLAIDEGNPQSEAFWIKNGFFKTGERCPNDFSAYLPMERKLC